MLNLNQDTLKNTIKETKSFRLAETNQSWQCKSPGTNVQRKQKLKHMFSCFSLSAFTFWIVWLSPYPFPSFFLFGEQTETNVTTNHTNPVLTVKNRIPPTSRLPVAISIPDDAHLLQPGIVHLRNMHSSMLKTSFIYLFIF